MYMSTCSNFFGWLANSNSTDTLVNVLRTLQTAVPSSSGASARLDKTARSCSYLFCLSSLSTMEPLAPHRTRRWNSVWKTSDIRSSDFVVFITFCAVTRYSPHCAVISLAVSKCVSKMSNPLFWSETSQGRNVSRLDSSRSRRQTSGAMSGMDTFCRGSRPLPSIKDLYADFSLVSNWKALLVWFRRSINHVSRRRVICSRTTSVVWIYRAELFSSTNYLYWYM